MNPNQIARIASLVGEPARTAMLLELMDGRSLTARELATAGHVSASTGSKHLSLMVEANLLSVKQHGRHRYHRLASPEVAQLLEGIMQLAAQTTAKPKRIVTGPKDAQMRAARTCYDHIAGRLGVAIAERLLKQGVVEFDGDAGLVTEQGKKQLVKAGVVPDSADFSQAGRRVFCRPCMDWSERRFHIAGRLGSLICEHSFRRGWVQRGHRSRALLITPLGQTQMRDWVGHDAWRQVGAEG